MKKLDNDNSVVISFKLFLICLVVTLVLGYINSITAPLIAKTAEMETLSAMNNLFINAEFIKINDSVYKAEIEGKTVGYAVVVTSERGYSGNIGMIVGFLEDLTVTGIGFAGEFSETIDIGTKVKEPEFINQFIGKKDTVIVSNKTAKDNEVEAVTGATVSSKAVDYGVKKASELLKEVLK